MIIKAAESQNGIDSQYAGNNVEVETLISAWGK
jgi:hypothetical protein